LCPTRLLLQPTASVFIVGEQSTKAAFAGSFSAAAIAGGAALAREIAVNPAVYITFMMT
jgi:hypothetical protein